MNILTTLHPGQNEKLLQDNIKTLGESTVVLSYKPLDFTKSINIAPGNLPPPDDAIRMVRDFLSSLSGESEIFTFLDWESTFMFSSLALDSEKLKKVNNGIEIIEENIKVQDFRLAPYMENLTKICGDIKLSGADRLFSKNPKLLIPRMIRGSLTNLLKSFNNFLEIRSKIPSNKFTGVLPIFNSEYETI
jgi:hypothetical protein